jgi:hypothetical protein
MTIMHWMVDDPELQARMEIARQIHADFLVEEAMIIADDKTLDIIETEKGFVINNAAVNRAKLQVETRRWTAGKLHAARFGEKMDVRGAGVQLTQVFAMPSNGRDDDGKVIEGDKPKLLPFSKDD